MCDSDANCSDTLVCYSDVPWLPKGVDSECLCSSWVGWEGPDCTELGPGAVFLISSASTQLFFGTLLYALYIWLCSEIRKKKYRSCGSVIIVLVLATFATFSFIMWRIATISTVLTPEKFERLGTSNFAEDSKGHPFSARFERWFLGFSLLFLVLAIFQMAISWIETGLRVFDLRSDYLSKFKAAKTLFIYMEILWIICAVVAWLFSAALVVFISAFFFTFLVISFIVGFLLLQELLKRKIRFLPTKDASFVGFSVNPKSGSELEIVSRISDPKKSAATIRKASKALSTVRSAFATDSLKFYGDAARFELMKKTVIRTGLILLFGFIVGMGGGIAYALMSLINGGWKHYSEPGHISPVMACNEMIPAGIWMGLAGVFLYLRVEVFVFLKNKGEDDGGSSVSEHTRALGQHKSTPKYKDDRSRSHNTINTVELPLNREDFLEPRPKLESL